MSQISTIAKEPPQVDYTSDVTSTRISEYLLEEKVLGYKIKYSLT